MQQPAACFGGMTLYPLRWLQHVPPTQVAIYETTYHHNPNDTNVNYLL